MSIDTTETRMQVMRSPMSGWAPVYGIAAFAKKKPLPPEAKWWRRAVRWIAGPEEMVAEVRLREYGGSRWAHHGWEHLLPTLDLALKFRQVIPWLDAKASGHRQAVNDVTKLGDVAEQLVAVLVMDLGYVEAPLHGHQPIRHQIAWELAKGVLGEGRMVRVVMECARQTKDEGSLNVSERR
jgi:hypothetical protein